MYTPLQLVKKYLHYYITANNRHGHGTHSPFIYNFIRAVLMDKKKYPAYNPIENLRHQLHTKNKTIAIKDFVAGSKFHPYKQQKIKSVFTSMAKPAKFDQLLFRMLRYYKSKYVLELGTCLGITTAYLASANTENFITTCEDNSNIAQIAKQHFNRLSLKNITQVIGHFDNTLKDTLNKIPQLDFVCINGNNCKEAILFYWNMLYNKAHNETLFIFDKIHGSAEMEEVWKKIQQLDMVTCTIDLFSIGIVSIRKEIKEPVHLSIRY